MPQEQTFDAGGSAFPHLRGVFCLGAASQLYTGAWYLLQQKMGSVTKSEFPVIVLN